MQIFGSRWKSSKVIVNLQQTSEVFQNLWQSSEAVCKSSEIQASHILLKKVGKYMLLCSSMFAFGTIFSEPVQNILNWFNFFWFLFLHQTKKKKFWHLRSLSSLFSSSLLYLPHVLFSSCSPNIPAPILFISLLTL